MGIYSTRKLFVRMAQTLRAKGTLISEIFYPLLQCDLSHRNTAKWPFSRVFLENDIEPCVAWEKSHVAGGRKSGVTNSCAFGPQGRAPFQRAQGDKQNSSKNIENSCEILAKFWRNSREIQKLQVKFKYNSRVPFGQGPFGTSRLGLFYLQVQGATGRCVLRVPCPFSQLSSDPSLSLLSHLLCSPIIISLLSCLFCSSMRALSDNRLQ